LQQILKKKLEFLDMTKRTEQEDQDYFHRNLIWGKDEDARRAMKELVTRLRMLEEQIEMFKKIDEFKNWIKN
jgi:hypothetical protein